MILSIVNPLEALGERPCCGFFRRPYYGELQMVPSTWGCGLQGYRQLPSCFYGQVMEDFLRLGGRYSDGDFPIASSGSFETNPLDFFIEKLGQLADSGHQDQASNSIQWKIDNSEGMAHGEIALPEGFDHPENLTIKLDEKNRLLKLIYDSSNSSLQCFWRMSQRLHEAFDLDSLEATFNKAERKLELKVQVRPESSIETKETQEDEEQVEPAPVNEESSAKKIEERPALEVEDVGPDETADRT